MSFHISVICADPEVRAMLAAALEPSAIATSPILCAHPDLPALIGEISWLSSPAEVSPRSDLAIVYDSVRDTKLVKPILSVLSPTRIMFLRPHLEYGTGPKSAVGIGIPWNKIDRLIVPFDNEEFYLRIYKMLKTPRAGNPE